MGDCQGRLGAVNLRPFVGMDVIVLTRTENHTKCRVIQLIAREYCPCRACMTAKSRKSWLRHIRLKIKSRKPCIVGEKLLWITNRKSWSLFQNPSGKSAWSAPWRRNHDDVISGLQWNLVISETMHAGKNYHGTLPGSHGRSFRIRHVKSLEAPLAEVWRLRHIMSGNATT